MFARMYLHTDVGVPGMPVIGFYRTAVPTTRSATSHCKSRDVWAVQVVSGETVSYINPEGVLLSTWHGWSEVDVGDSVVAES